MPKVADSDKSRMERDTKPLVPKAKPKAGKVVKTTLKSSNKPKKPAKPQKQSKKKAKKPVKPNKSTKKKPKKKPKYESTTSDSDSESYSESESDSDSISSSSSSDSDYNNSNVKRSRDNDSAVISTLPIKQEPEMKRDSWMTDSTNLKMNTFTKERKTAFKPNAKQQIDSYDPTKNVNELNPYWKKNGTGLPAFKKPKTDDDCGPMGSGYDYTNVCTKPATSSTGVSSTNNALSLKGSLYRETFNLSDSSGDKDVKQEQPLLTDEQINELAAKAIKAELKCDVKLAKQLNEQLLLARQVRAEYMASGKSAAEFMKSKQKTEHVLLTRTDASGNVRPLMPSVDRKMDANNQNKGPSTSGGQRNRYIITDDRYDIKMMFEREKHATAAESNLQYANILAKNKKSNNDLDGVFEDCVRKNIAEDNSEQREIQAAIKEHQRTAAAMDNCKLCFDSAKMEKYLILSMGTKIYMTLPTNVGLQVNHCILTSMQHVSACTLLDEDAWEELTNYRIALTQMFAAQKKDVIFFEIANKLYKRQHLAVHCVPIPDSHGEMAPFFFKKAIEESEQEWSINKQLITLDRKPLCEAIPKGLPYFWVHFGMGRGFAHVIEDEDRFPENFAQAIIGGMLGLNPHCWRKPGLDKNIKEKVKTFMNVWKKYDFNEK